jgi:hypothetical protein
LKSAKRPTKSPILDISGQKNGASEGIRTLDTHVGNVMLYQAELRSLPEAALSYKCGFQLQAQI